MSLKIVHSQEPKGKEAVLKRVREMRRASGKLFCNRCGCGTSITTVTGAFVKSGRKQGGTVIDKDVCAECWRQGIIISMLPEMERIK